VLWLKVGMHKVGQKVIAATQAYLMNYHISLVIAGMLANIEFQVAKARLFGQ